MKKRHNNLRDITFVAVFIFAICFTGLIAIRMFYEVNDTVQQDNLTGSTIGQQTISTYNTNLNNGLDIAILVALIMAFLVAGITAMLVDVSPLFFVVGIIYYVLSFIFIPVVANIYLTTQGLDNFSVVADSLPIAYLVMNNYVLIWVVMSALILVALYAKQRG